MREMGQPEEDISAGQRYVLLRSGGYLTARAMQEQGSRFYARLGAALEAADRENCRLIYATWPDACWDFHLRGLALERASGE
ncbi:MAG: hypothetical protein ACR2J4_07285 [Deinococcus sp.]